MTPNLMVIIITMSTICITFILMFSFWFSEMAERYAGLNKPSLSELHPYNRSKFLAQTCFRIAYRALWATAAWTLVWFTVLVLIQLFQHSVSSAATLIMGLMLSVFAEAFIRLLESKQSSSGYQSDYPIRVALLVILGIGVFFAFRFFIPAVAPIEEFTLASEKSGITMQIAWLKEILSNKWVVAVEKQTFELEALKQELEMSLSLEEALSQKYRDIAAALSVSQTRRRAEEPSKLKREKLPTKDEDGEEGKSR